MHECLIKCGLVSGCCGCAVSHTQALCHSLLKHFCQAKGPSSYTECFFSLCKCVWRAVSACSREWEMDEASGIKLHFLYAQLVALLLCGVWPVSKLGSGPGSAKWATRTGVATSICAFFRAWPTLREIKEKFSVLSWKSEWTLDL